MNTDLDFSDALVALKAGERIARRGWNGKGMWLALLNADEWDLDGITLAGSVDEAYERLPFIAMKTADDKLVPWLASQTDLLADDWEILDG